MRLERIAAVWGKDHDPATGLQDTHHFRDRRAVILHVLDHFMAEDQVECPGGERQEFPGSVDDLRRTAVRRRPIGRAIPLRGVRDCRRALPGHLHGSSARGVG